MINIHIEATTAADARRQMLELLNVNIVAAPTSLTPASETQTGSGETVITNTPRAGETAEQTEARTNRAPTKAQIKAAEKAAAKAAAEQAASNIHSAPESRVGPEDTPEVDAQDQADEKAEVEETKKELTHDDVRAALGTYVKKFGMDATQIDGPKVFKLIFGEKVAKISDIPPDQESLQKAVDGLNEMLAKNPYGREAVKAA
jgi:ribosomal protein S20